MLSHLLCDLMQRKPLISTKFTFHLFIQAVSKWLPTVYMHGVKYLGLYVNNCCLIVHLCPTVSDPWMAACQASLSFTISWNLFELISIELVMPSNHLFLCRLLLLLPSIFSCIRVFSSESALCIRWPKYGVLELQLQYQSFQEYSGLISFRIDCFDLLTVWETLKSLLLHHSLKESIFWDSVFFMAQLSYPYLTTGKITTLYGPLLAKWCFCFLIHCLGLLQLFFQGASIFYFHGCSHCLKWFGSPRK